MSNSEEQFIKIDKIINNIINQLDYLSNNTDLKKIKENKSYDFKLEKIRNNSDSFIYLSGALNNLISTKHSIAEFDKREMDIMKQKHLGKK